MFLLSGGVMAGGGVATASYAVGLEPDWLELTRSVIPTRWLPPGASLRFLHLSDLHASFEVPLARIEAAFAMGLKEKPDAIFLTGDYITTGNDVDLNQYRDVLAILPKVAPTFACVGNHDGGRWAHAHDGFDGSKTIRDLLSSAGIQVLHNRYVEPTLGAHSIQVVGLGDLWTREFDSATAFAGLPKESERLRVVLSHNPDTKAILQYYSWELMLSGHTHGGQINVPGFGPPVLPIEDVAYFEGLYEWQGRRLYITRGVGGVFGAVRFNCRPEVTILELVHGESPVELTESRPRKRT